MATGPTTRREGCSGSPSKLELNCLRVTLESQAEVGTLVASGQALNPELGMLTATVLVAMLLEAGSVTTLLEAGSATTGPVVARSTQECHRHAPTLTTVLLHSQLVELAPGSYHG